MRAATELARAFKQAGFTLVRCNTHPIYRCPCGHKKVVSAKTPGKGRAKDNADAQIAKTLLECRQRRTA